MINNKLFELKIKSLLFGKKVKNHKNFFTSIMNKFHEAQKIKLMWDGNVQVNLKLKFFELN